MTSTIPAGSDRTYELATDITGMRAEYSRGERLVVLATGEVGTYWETIRPHGIIEMVVDGQARVFLPREVGRADTAGGAL